ncbi:O-antigen ligase family protein [Paraburkholderia adhaesiva]|uniref:O-antigen ligase family protein n=1 Tax=Paraburkholderia adhaesiva TaxID=2883244 RepID=UPI001F3FADFB|nr:O-antigen ligase family protein [Paraburkholderia adhaesiva]
MIDTSARLPVGRPGTGSGAWDKSTRTLIWIVLLGGIALSPLSDFLSVYALKGQVSGDVGARYSLFLRSVTVAALIASMLLGGRVRLSSWRLCCLAMVTAFMSCVSLTFDDMTGQEFAEELIAIAKVFSLFVYIAAMVQLKDRQLEKVEAVMRMALLVYALAIIAGAVFSIDMFRSYRGDTQIRAGYKGIIYAQNEASALLLTGLALAYLRVLREGWKAKSVIFVATLIAAAFLLGTKGAIVAALGVIAVYSYAKYGALKASVRLAPAVVLVFVAAVTVYFVSPSVRQAVDLSVQYFSYQSDRADGNKIATVLMSSRNVKFANVWNELSSRNFLPLLIGGYPTVRYPIEMDGPDLILIMGIPVFLLYLRRLFRLYVRRGDGSVAKYGRYFFFLLLLIACSAGHVLTSAIVAPYLAVIAEIVRRRSGDERRPIAGRRSKELK